MLTQSKTLPNTYYRSIFACVAFFLLIIHIALINLNVWPLNGDEAQYWGWSQHLDFGYYSKPPFLAWLIAFTTSIFGNGPIALRLGSMLCHTITAIFLYLIGQRFYNEKTGFFAGIIYLTLPGVTFSSIVISTDPPLVMFWTMYIYFFVRALSEEKNYLWMLSGVALGFAMLSKYAALFLPISALLYFITDQTARINLKKIGFYISLLIALLILSPNLVWNAKHAFVSVQAVQSNADWQQASFSVNHLISFLAAQIAIITPIFFIVYICILAQFKKIKQADPLQRIWFFFIWPRLLTISIEAFISGAHANWAVAVYITMIIAVVSLLVTRKKEIWIYLTIMLNVILIVTFFDLPHIIQKAGLKIPQETSMLNWPNIGKEINTQAQLNKVNGLIVDQRMLLGMTLYYTQQPQSFIYKWNPSGVIHDQYDMVNPIVNQQGENFVFVTYFPKTPCEENSFQSFQLLKMLVEPVLDGRTFPVYLYLAQNFKGYDAICH